ncbi:MAG: SMC family ATPase [Balneolales bacterium]|nr:SMC family ATPase [Balneolales bacterium]
MLPKKLTIQGLYSYQEKQTIDFERLLESQIFGIFGTVGSGKSSVLEAISYAIYGETERLNKQDKRNYNMMNLKSNSLLIDFECTNHRDEDWRFIVEGKRAGNDFENVRTFNRRTFQRIGGDWQAVEESNPADIIGLSYDNFRRTIIIPQGKFQEFLQLGDADRTRMLKEIFNLDRFEFSLQTGILIKSSTGKMENLRGQMLQYEDLSEESITLHEEKAATLRKELDSKRKLKIEKTDAFAALEQKKGKHLKREELKDRLQKLSNQQPEIMALEEKLRRYERCLRLFSEPLNQKRRLKNELKNLNLETEQGQKNLAEIQSQLNAIAEEWEKVSNDYAVRDARKTKLADYETLLQIKINEQEIAALSQQRKKIKKELEQFALLLAEKREEKQKLESSIAEKQDSITDEKELYEIEKWYHRKQDISDAAAAKQNELSTVEKRIQTINENLRKGIAESNLQLETSFSSDLSLKEVQQQLGSFVTETYKQSEELQNQLSHLKVHQKLGEFANALHEGSACPLCGSNEHPSPLKNDSSKEIAKVENLLLITKEKLEKAGNLKSRYAELGGKMNETREQYEELNKQQKELKGKQVAHEKEFVWEVYDPQSKTKFQAELERQELAKNKIKALQQKLKELLKKMDKESEASENQKEILSSLDGRLNKLQGAESSLIESLKSITYTDFGLIDAGTINTEMRQLRAEIQLTDERYEQLKNKREELSTRLTVTETQLSQTKKQLKLTESNYKEANEKLLAGLSNSEFESTEEVASILAAEPNTEKLRNQIDGFKRELHSAEIQKAELDTELGTQTFDENAFNELKKEIDLVTNEVDQLIENSGAAARQAEKLKTDFATKRKLQKEIDLLDARLNDLDVLKKLFSSSGFVNYISSVYLRQLCDTANKRFYVLTRQQLRLELTDKNNFHVRDYLNDGRLRSVKTLSGGQTFQASLCLALALAESVQQRNKTRQNFFFLDEGFGSLDKESLQTVFNTLKSLRQESRVVGIISHVEELQQEIDVYLRIENTSAEGSKVVTSWT